LNKQPSLFYKVENILEKSKKKDILEFQNFFCWDEVDPPTASIS
jgi:hypothetical protein